MNKKMIKTLASITCGLGIATTIPFVVSSCNSSSSNHLVASYSNNSKTIDFPVDSIRQIAFPGWFEIFYYEDDVTTSDYLSYSIIFKNKNYESELLPFFKESSTNQKLIFGSKTNKLDSKWSGINVEFSVIFIYLKDGKNIQSNKITGFNIFIE